MIEAVQFVRPVDFGGQIQGLTFWTPDKTKDLCEVVLVGSVFEVRMAERTISVPMSNVSWWRERPKPVSTGKGGKL